MFLSITGFGEVEVFSDGASEGEPDVGGEDARTFDGSLRTVVAWEKRTWSFETGLLTQANYDALKAVIANGAHVACSGDALSGASVTCRVKLRGGVYIDYAGTAFRRSASLTLTEV